MLLRQLIRRHGTALLYISHDLLSVLQLCDSLAVLHSGTIVDCMPIAEIEQARHPRDSFSVARASRPGRGTVIPLQCRHLVQW
jgi:ABC-type dipeptide/oligopeptide/nickel transport system ATPase component